MPYMKRVHRDKKASVHLSTARNEKRFSSRSWTVGQPLCCRSASIRRAPSAPTAAPAAESLHASTAFARVTSGNNLSSPKPGHTTGGSGRRSAQRTVGRGEAGQTKVPTFRSASKATVPLALQGTINNCSERLFASTNQGNPM